MINYIWFGIIFIGVIFGLLTGKGEFMSKGIMDSAQGATNFIISLVGIMCFWCGVMKVAEKSGLTSNLAKLVKPVLKILFKESSQNEEAMGAIVMNLTANMLGLSNAATPFGIKAMEELSKSNTKKGHASNDMALFLVMNAACIQLLPSTVISIRAAAGSNNPASIIVPAILSTTIACLVGVICCKILQRYF
ncbi:nucleoside recognition domain-containing protein [Clostridium tarantellae]|uniref:Spore maturation protein n=1 Tax=Clostridium tarantellae TaxID=39493 RepID=A0A6I1ML03_9CLOT|nr:nucleoside recognition domain-containing protein [Clostridium tarantellae]MPQ43700.1 spore maturation protein [Clostridium tarantellae]